MFQNSILSLYWIICANIHSYLICSLVGRHLVFPSLTTVNTLAAEVGIQLPESMCTIFGEICTRKDNYWVLRWTHTLLRNCHTVSHDDCTALYSHHQWCGGLIPPHALVFTVVWSCSFLSHSVLFSSSHPEWMRNSSLWPSLQTGWLERCCFAH